MPKLPRPFVVITVALLLLVAIVTGTGWFLSSQSKSREAAVEKYTRLDIVLVHGQLTTAAPTYLVQPGTKLEFHVDSEALGEISVPTQPVQTTVTLKERFTTFQFIAPVQPASYQLLYRMNDHSTVVILGTIVVKDTSK